MSKNKNNSRSKSKYHKKYGAGTLILHAYRHTNGKITMCVALGFEYSVSPSDERYLTYSISSGSSLRKDGTYKGSPHLWNTAKRELREEFKNIKIDMGNQRKPDLHIGRTPIWIGHVRKGVRQSSFIPNNEMSDFRYVLLSDMLKPSYDYHNHKYIVRTIRGKWVHVSKYALSVVRKAKQLYLI